MCYPNSTYNKTIPNSLIPGSQIANCTDSIETKCSLTMVGTITTACS